MTKKDVYAATTERIMAALEAGTVPWRKPWDAADGLPYSLSSGKPYRGVNVFLLWMTAYSDPRWGTFKALKEAAVHAATSEGREIIEEIVYSKGYPKKNYYEIINGKKQLFLGGVRKGEKSTAIILWKPTKRKVENADGELEESKYMLLREYAVFNAEQADGVPDLEKPEGREHEPIEVAEQIVQGYEGGPGIMWGGGRAVYNISSDLVRMPEPQAFVSDEAYYSSLFHELVHSTGHEKRLNRLEPALFGTDPYAKEELVAEVGASMLAGVAQFSIAGGEQSAAYIAGWLRALENDHKLVIQAAAQAQRAADLILGTQFQETPEAEMSVAA